MNIRDFTVSHYERLIEAALEEDWEFLTVQRYLEADALPDDFIVLRHDVDRKIENALALARLEAEHGIDATYYFRTSTFDADAVRQIDELGHEIGYHYEDLAATDGDRTAAQRRFAENLEDFRVVTAVNTVCAHGNAFSAQYNPDLWTGRLDELEDYGILGEAYLSVDIGPEQDVYYLSDTHRTWDTKLSDFGTDQTTSELLELPEIGTIETSDDLIAALRSHPCQGLFLLAHPSRWSRSRGEFAQMVAWDVSAEIAMSAINRAHALLS